MKTGVQCFCNYLKYQDTNACHGLQSGIRRYNIVSDNDLKLAAQRQEAYLKAQMGTKTVTIKKIGATL